MKKRLITILMVVFACSMMLFVACGSNSTSSTTSSDETSTETSTSVDTSQTFEVTFVYGNGDADLIKVVTYGMSVVQPESPTRENYDFDGWYLNGAKYNFASSVVADITLEAQWSEGIVLTSGYLMTFDVCSGATISFTEIVQPTRVKLGESFSFSLSSSVYYSGDLLVEANGVEVEAENGLYVITVEGDTTITISGLTFENATFAGSGTSSDPYQVSTPYHLYLLASYCDSANTTYVAETVYYTLMNDIDFEGATINQIGSDFYTYFTGYFFGQGYTIKNFTVSNTSGGYIGLFGCAAFAYIYDLTIENYTISALNVADSEIGSLVGYALGCQIVNCHAVDGTLNVSGITDSYLDVGGLVGFAQSYYYEYDSTVYNSPSIIAYSSTDVTISSLGETLYTLGGIVGQQVGVDVSASAAIVNCYSTSDLSDSMIVGGICGYLRYNSTIVSSYYVGDCYAENTYGSAMSGLLVGAADTDTSIANSFAVGTASAAGYSSEYSYVGNYDYLIGLVISAGSYSITDQAVVVYNCYNVDGGDVIVDGTPYSITDKDDLLALMNWNEYDWNFVDVNDYELPTCDSDGLYSIDYTLTIDFNGEALQTTSDEYVTELVLEYTGTTGYMTDMYSIFSSDGVNSFMSENGLISYGFFFDEACTIAVPSSFYFTTSMTVYMGFADYSEVEGTYYIFDGDVEYKLDFSAYGYVQISSLTTSSYYTYSYNGTTITIYDCNLVTLSDTAVESEVYTLSIFAVMNEDNTLTLFDNYFFTTDLPLTAIKANAAIGDYFAASGDIYEFYANGTGQMIANEVVYSFTYAVVDDVVTLTFEDASIMVGNVAEKTITFTTGDQITIERFDDFVGEWQLDFASEYNYVFDGKGNYTYGTTSGTYTVKDDTLTLDNNESLSFVFDSYGFLCVYTNGEYTSYLSVAGSYAGLWYDSTYGYYIQLYGVTSSGIGYAYDSYGYSYTYFIDTSYLTDEDDTNDYIIVALYYDSTLSGYMFDDGFGFLTGYFAVDGGSYYHYMAYIDNYMGIWYSVDDFTVYFNGYGLYYVSYTLDDGSSWDLIGTAYIFVGDEYTAVQYELVDGKAVFTYNEIYYTAQYIDGLLYISSINGSVYFFEGDGMSSYDYVDLDGNSYVFNGKSVGGAGELTVTTTTGEVTVYDYYFDEDSNLLVYAGEDYVGSVALDSYGYLVLVFEDDSYVYLVMETVFTTTMVSSYGLLNYDYIQIGYFNYSGYAYGYYCGYSITAYYYSSTMIILYYDSSVFAYLYYVDGDYILYDGSSYYYYSVMDEYAGGYTAADGTEIYFSGMLNSPYYYALAVMTASDGTETYMYYQEIDGVVYLGTYDDAGEVFTPLYIVSLTYSEGATAYTDVYDDVTYTVYLTPVEAD